MDRKEIVTVPKAHWQHGWHCGAPVLAAIESRSCCVLINYTAWLEKKIVALPNAHWPHVWAFSVSLPLGLQVAPERKVMVCGIKLYCMDSKRAQSQGVWYQTVLHGQHQSAKSWCVALNCIAWTAPEHKVMVCGIKLYCMDSTRAQSQGVWH